MRELPVNQLDLQHKEKIVLVWKPFFSISSINFGKTHFFFFFFFHVGQNSWWATSERSFEPPLDKTNKIACALCEDSDQPGHPPSLIRVFAVRIKKAWVLSYPLNAQRRLWSDWADAQADLSLRWAHNHFVGFVMRRLILKVNQCHKVTVN